MSTYAALLVRPPTPSESINEANATTQNEHATLPSFTPEIPSTLLQPLAILFLTTAFILSFGFSTYGPPPRLLVNPRLIPCFWCRLRSKGLPTTELAVGGAASLFGGFGVVFAFCAAGLNV